MPPAYIVMISRYLDIKFVILLWIETRGRNDQSRQVQGHVSETKWVEICRQKMDLPFSVSKRLYIFFSIFRYQVLTSKDLYINVGPDITLNTGSEWWLEYSYSIWFPLGQFIDFSELGDIYKTGFRPEIAALQFTKHGGIWG